MPRKTECREILNGVKDRLVPMLINKIILTGFMGSGKSTLAPLLASKLGFSVIDADKEVVLISGYSSIREIISQVNEAHFRDLEAQIAASLRDASNVVIATGGGVIGRPENMHNLMHGGGVVIFLDTSFDEVSRRIPDRSSRPIFHDPLKAAQIYQERLPIYREYADLCVSTDHKTQDQICAEITNWLNTQK